jgi:hypothetical protein
MKTQNDDQEEMTKDIYTGRMKDRQAYTEEKEREKGGSVKEAK